MPRTRRTSAQIQQLLSDFRSSGQTRAAFCAARRLPVTTLDSYRRRAVQPPAGLVEIDLSRHLPVKTPPDLLAIVLANGRRIELTWPALPLAAESLAQLARCLEAD